MAPRIVDKEAKRRQIQKAALKVFARKGIYDFKMIEIAEAAGVGKGTLYEYFPSKNDLIVGAFIEFMAEFEDQVMAAAMPLDDPAEKLRTIVAASFAYCAENPAVLETMFDFYAAGIPRRDGRSLLQEFAPMYQQMIDHLATIIDDGISRGVFRTDDPKETASLILALLDGVFFQISLGLSDINNTEYAERISGILLDGLLSDPKRNED